MKHVEAKLLLLLLLLLLLMLIQAILPYSQSERLFRRATNTLLTSEKRAGISALQGTINLPM